MAPANGAKATRAQLLRRRVLSMDAYVAELREPHASAERLRRQYGERTLPIPVPLVAGETEAQYEQRFLLAYPVFRNNPTAHPAGERGSRIAFAQRVAKEFVRAASAARRQGDVDRTKTAGLEETPERPEATGEHDSMRIPDRLPPPRAAEYMYRKRYVTLEQYRRDDKSGRLAALKTLSSAQKLERFGVPVIPIFVPLAHGESKEQYEARFVRWIARNNLTLDKLRRDPNTLRERSLRMHFAILTARGTLRFEPNERAAKRARVEDAVDAGGMSAHGRWETALSPYGPSRAQCCGGRDQGSVGAYVTCGCDACLHSAIGCFANELDASGSPSAVALDHSRIRRRELESREAVGVFVDPPLTVESNGVTLDAIDVSTVQDQGVDSWRPGSPSTRIDESAGNWSALEGRLVRAFDELNEQIVLNQKALDTVEEELAHSPPADFQEMTTLHEENQEMRGLIQEECVKRLTLLALLVVCMWRDDRKALDRMVRDPTASDVAHVQRRSYERLVGLANVQATQKAEYAAQLSPKNEELSRAALESLQDFLSVAYDDRRRELTMLLRFDSALRERVRACGHLLPRMTAAVTKV